MKSLAPILTAAALVAASAVGLAQDARPAPPAGAPARRPGGEREGGLRFNPVLTALDTNADGTLDEQELANATAALKKLDKNTDGKLNPEELRPAFRGERGGPGQPATNAEALTTRLLQFDKNADGKLTKDELPERMQAMLVKGDLDKDGSLTKEEMTKLAAAQAPAAPARGEGRRHEEHEDDDDD